MSIQTLAASEHAGASSDSLHQYDQPMRHTYTQVVKRIPRYAQVLELGCLTGEMSQMMRKECEASFIVGIEEDEQAAGQARRYCDYVFSEDLDDPHGLDALEMEKFDVITLVDMLGALQNPLALLQRLKPLLLDGAGKILLTVPNVNHAATRLDLLTGELGQHDTAHQLYTLNTLKVLVEKAGYIINEVDYTWRDMPDTVIARTLGKLDIEPTQAVLSHFHTNDAKAEQFIVSLSLADDATRYDVPPTGEGELKSELKSLGVSWQSWQQMFDNLQQKDQIIHGMEIQMAHCRQELRAIQRRLQDKELALQTLQRDQRWTPFGKVGRLLKGTDSRSKATLLES